MVDAREILKSESELLEQLSSAVSGFATDREGDQFENQNLRCWGEELTGYREVDVKYQALSAEELKAALAEEIQVLTRCANAVQSDSEAGKYWKKTLEANIWYTEQTLNRVA